MSARPASGISHRRAISARGAKERPSSVAAEYMVQPRERSAQETMDLKWLARRHEEIVTKERNREQARVLREWEVRRARVEEESTRNAEASRFMSIVDRRAEKTPMPEP